MIHPANADPIDIVNSDGNREIHWNYSDPANYTLSNTTVSGGHATLEWKNEISVENTKAAYDQAAVRQNVDTSAFPGSVVLGYAPQAIHSFAVQPNATVSMDAYIAEDTPGISYGTSPIVDFNSRTGAQRRPLLYFDVGSIPSNATILNATLSFWVKSGQNSPFDFSVRALNRSYNEMNADWMHYDTPGLWTVPGGDYSTKSSGAGHMTNVVGWHGYEIGALIEGWVKGTVQNNGLIIVADSTTGTNTEKQVVSSDDAAHATQWPKLFVNYTLIIGPGDLESRAIGPGTNATFTSVNWTASVRSLASDEFSSNSLNPRWSWMRDPRSSGGAYDVNTTRPGWLRIVGGGNTYSGSASLKSNYLYQNVTGDFTSRTYLEEQFTTNTMGAGLLLMYDQHNWVSIVKYGSGSSAKLWISAYQDDVGLSTPQVTWSGLTTVYLSIDKTSAGAQVNYSADGVSWIPIYTYVPPHPFSSLAMIGLEVFSSSASNPVVLFDYFRIDPFVYQTTIQVEARLGNSTSLADPSWTAWSAPIPSGGVALNGTWKYLQYSVHLESGSGWLSPAFTGIAVHYSRFAPDGVVATLEKTVPFLKRWISIWTFENYTKGMVAYYYSTDHGSSWIDLINKYPNSVSSTSQSMIIRAFIHTDDTLYTPRLDLINATYAMNPASFYISAPSSVGAGAPFQITVTAKDSLNNTIPWTGDVTLHAMDSTGTADASSELSATTISISSIGSSVLWETYLTAETIRILASYQTSAALGNPIQVTPGPATKVSISPSVSSMNENSSRNFTATAYDANDNANLSASWSWSVDSALGTINATSGRFVRLSVGAPYVTGNLNVSSSGMNDSLRITVTPMRYPPVIRPIPRQVHNENFGLWTLDLTPYVSDPADAPAQLQYRISNESIVSVQIGPGTLVVTFGTLTNLYGVDYLNLVVTNQAGLSARATIVVEIRFVNQAPTIDSIDPLVVHYGAPYVYSMMYYVHDVETPIDQLVLSVDPTSANYVQVNGLSLTFYYPKAFDGTTQLVGVTVSDGQLNSSTTIQVTISSDQVPVLTNPLPDVTLDQGSSLINAFDLDQHFMDPDLEVLFYAFGNTHVSIDIQLNHTVDFHAPNDWSGVEFVTFRATDPRGARVEDTIKVTVLPVNQPPRISGVPDLQVHYDALYDFDLKPYITDLDGEREVRTITTDDGHITVNGTVMSLLYPQAMNGMTVHVTITVHDSGLSASCTINVTVSNDFPPVLSHMMPDHSFLENQPIDYPIGSGLASYFTDPDGRALRFEAFVSTPNVTVGAVTVSGKWVLEFVPDRNYYGQSSLTIRAIEVGTKGIAEDTVRLTVIHVPQPPMLQLPAKFNVTEGVQTILDMSKMVSDPDSQLSDFTFVVAGPYTDQGQVRVQNAILVFVFPVGFVPTGMDSKEFTINVTVYDQTGLSSNDSIMVHVEIPPISSVDKPMNPLLIVGMIALAAAAIGGFAIALYRRKKPFVIRDMMLIHNDGFLIARYASPHTGEIDEDILSGMLTAVLNFVEDSMSSSQDQLKTFGFKEYQVLVSRGTKTFVAIVYEGDVPSDIDKPLNEFIAKIEKIYRKKIAEWTGDIETDFAGSSVLLESFVKEHDKGNRKKPLAGLWTHEQKPPAPEK